MRMTSSPSDGANLLWRYLWLTKIYSQVITIPQIEPPHNTEHLQTSVDFEEAAARQNHDPSCT